MPVPTFDPKAAGEDVAKQLLAGYDFFQKNYPGLAKIINDVEAVTAGLNGVEVKTVVEEMNKIKAQFDTVKRQIANNSKGGLFIPGLEAEAEKFSIARAIVAIKTGNWKSADFEKKVFDLAREKAGAAIGVDSSGSFFVPDQVIADVIAAIYVRSQFISLSGEGTTRVSVLDGLTGIPVKIPKFLGGMIAYWIGEEDSYVESAAKVGNITMTPKKLGLLTRMTDEMRRFQGFGYENLMRQDMIRAAAKKIDYTVPYGKATENEPRGIMQLKDVNLYSCETHAQVYRKAGSNPVPNSDLTGTALAGTGGECTFDDLQNMQGMLEDQNLDVDASYATISAPRYFRRLSQLKVQNFSGQVANQQYLVGLPSLTAQRLQSIIGDFGKTTQIASNKKPLAALNGTSSAAASFGDVFSGNFSEVVFGRWSGIEIVDDGGTGSGFIKDETLVKMRMYADLGYRYEAALNVCTDAQMRG